MSRISYARHRFPPIVIQHAVRLCFRFALSYRDVEDLLAERGIDASYETVRRWALKFGHVYAREIRLRRPVAERHVAGGRSNNRAKVSHEPTRRRERQRRGFRSPGSAQRFLAVHAAVYNQFNIQRHLISRRTLKNIRAEAFAGWRAIVAARAINRLTLLDPSSLTRQCHRN